MKQMKINTKFPIALAKMPCDFNCTISFSENSFLIVFDIPISFLQSLKLRKKYRKAEKALYQKGREMQDHYASRGIPFEISEYLY